MRVWYFLLAVVVCGLMSGCVDSPTQPQTTMKSPNHLTPKGYAGSDTYVEGMWCELQDWYVNNQYGGTDLICTPSGVDEEQLPTETGSGETCYGACPVDPDDPWGPVQYGSPQPTADAFETPSLAELAACVANPIECNKVWNSRSDALDKIRDTLPPNVVPHNNQYDALRHAYWMALSASRMNSESRAKWWGDLHEQGSYSIQEKCMDTWNNNKGAEIGAQLGPTATNDQIWSAVVAALTSGQLKTLPYSC